MKKLLVPAMLFGVCLTASAQTTAATQSFSASWGAVTNSVKYQVKSRVDTGATTTDEVAAPATKVTLTKEILTGQKLYVSVRSCDSIWCGDWSTEVAFTMPAKPATPGTIVIQLVVAP